MDRSTNSYPHPQWLLCRNSHWRICCRPISPLSDLSQVSVRVMNWWIRHSVSSNPNWNRYFCHSSPISRLVVGAYLETLKTSRKYHLEKSNRFGELSKWTDIDTDVCWNECSIDCTETWEQIYKNQLYQCRTILCLLKSVEKNQVLIVLWHLR